MYSKQPQNRISCLLSWAACLLLLVSAGAGQGRGNGVRRVEARVEAGSFDNSLLVHLDKGARPELGSSNLRFSSRVPSLLDNARIEKVRAPAPESYAPGTESYAPGTESYLVLFDVTPEAAAWAGRGFTELRLRFEAPGATGGALFDVEEVVLALEIEAPPVGETVARVSDPDLVDDDIVDDDFGGWGEAVNDGNRETESGKVAPASPATPPPVRVAREPRRPRPQVPDIAGQAGGIAERARQDKARNRARVGGIIDAISDIADTFTGGRRGGQPPVHAPVFPADDIPGQPSANRPRQKGGTPPAPPAPPASRSPGCVIFDQLNYGNDAHFLVKVESGRPNDAIAYYVISVPAQSSNCSGGRNCLDFYLRSLVPGQRTQVLGSYRSRSGASRAAQKTCTDPLNR